MVYDMENITQSLRGLPDLIENYYRNIPEDMLDIKRNETAWTLREHLYHIVGVQNLLYSRLLKIKNEENPVIEPYFPENEESRDQLYSSMEEAFSTYREMREKQLALVVELSQAELEKEAQHPEYMQYNIPLIIQHMIFHEYGHMYRVEEIWQTRDEYFT